MTLLRDFALTLLALLLAAAPAAAQGALTVQVKVFCWPGAMLSPGLR